MLECGCEVVLIFDEGLHLGLVGQAEVFVLLGQPFYLLLEVLDLSVQLLHLLLRLLLARLQPRLKR